MQKLKWPPQKILMKELARLKRDPNYKGLTFYVRLFVYPQEWKIEASTQPFIPAKIEGAMAAAYATVDWRSASERLAKDMLDEAKENYVLNVEVGDVEALAAEMEEEDELSRVQRVPTSSNDVSEEDSTGYLSPFIGEADCDCLDLDAHDRPCIACEGKEIRLEPEQLVELRMSPAVETKLARYRDTILTKYRNLGTKSEPTFAEDSSP